jgi:hypothetical protein
VIPRWASRRVPWLDARDLVRFGCLLGLEPVSLQLLGRRLEPSEIALSSASTFPCPPPSGNPILPPAFPGYVSSFRSRIPSRVVARLLLDRPSVLLGRRG